MASPSFEEFFRVFKDERLQDIFEQANKDYKEAMDDTISRAVKDGKDTEALLAELSFRLPTVIFNHSVRLNVALLKEYHEWLTQNFQLKPKDHSPPGA